MFDAQFIVNPYPTYEHLLANGRMHWADMQGGAWLVPHYNDMLALLRDSRLSADRTGGYLQGFTPEQQANLQVFDRTTRRWLVSMDNDPHLRLRRLLSKGFTPRTIENLRPDVQRLADELIDQLIEDSRETGEVELMHAFAHQLPALVIADMLGVPREDQPQFVTWSDDLAALLSDMSPSYETALRGEHGLSQMIEYFRTIVAERRLKPTNDLVSLLMAVEEQGDVLSEEELLAQCAMFLFAGHETTRNLIGNGLVTLLQHPDQLELLRRDPGLLKGAIDEMVRYESPVQLLARTALEDFEFNGTQIKRGQMVMMLPGAANRDPEVFEQPERFDITRSGVRPMSFGHGAHICIGMALAQLEAQIAIETLLRRLPSLRLTTPTPDWSPNFLLRGVRTLRLAFDLDPHALALIETDAVASQDAVVV